MIRFKRPRTSVIVLMAYLLAGALVELCHKDPAGLILQSCPALTNHTCGSDENHLPPDQKRHCLACTQSMQRASITSESFWGIDACPPGCLGMPIIGQLLLETDFLYSGKRGPPLA